MIDSVTITQGMLIITALVLLIYDLVIYIRSGVNATISTVLYEWAKSYPIIPLLIGIILGHIFW